MGGPDSFCTMKYRTKSNDTVEAIGFQEFVQIGIDQGVPLTRGMPRSFYYKDVPVTHENDNCYLVGSERFERGQYLVTGNGLKDVPVAFDAEEFHATYEQVIEELKPNPLMTFGRAIEALKHGKRVAREGWNGKGMYLWLLPAAMVKAEWCREPHLKAVAEANGGEIEALGSIRMMTANKKVLTGWLASQTDMLSEDWVILED